MQESNFFATYANPTEGQLTSGFKKVREPALAVAEALPSEDYSVRSQSSRRYLTQHGHLPRPQSLSQQAAKALGAVPDRKIGASRRAGQPEPEWKRKKREREARAKVVEEVDEAVERVKRELEAQKNDPDYVFKVPLSEHEQWEIVHGPDNDPGWCFRRTSICCNGMLWYVQTGTYIFAMVANFLGGFTLEGTVLLLTWLIDIVWMAKMTRGLFDATWGKKSFDELTWGQDFSLRNSRAVACCFSLFMYAPYMFCCSAFRAPGAPPDDRTSALFHYRLGSAVHAASGGVPQAAALAFALTLTMATKITIGTTTPGTGPTVLAFVANMIAVCVVLLQLSIALARLRINGPSGRAADDDAFTLSKRPRRYLPLWWKWLVYLYSLIELPTRVGLFCLLGVGTGGWVLVVLAGDVVLKLLYSLYAMPTAELRARRNRINVVHDLIFWFLPAIVMTWTPHKEGRGFWRLYGPLVLLHFAEGVACVLLPYLAVVRPGTEDAVAGITGVIASGPCVEFTAARLCDGEIPLIWFAAGAGAFTANWALLAVLLATDDQFPLLRCLCNCCALCCCRRIKTAPAPPRPTEADLAAANEVNGRVVFPGEDD